MPIGMVNCGENGLMSLAAEPDDVKACLTDSVLAIMTTSGPAAATRPLFDAILINEEVGGGRASDGQGDGSSLTLASPAMERKPSA